MPDVTAFVIGDPHFKKDNIPDGLAFIEKCVTAAKECKPTFIVVLGDMLDTHEVVRVQPHKLATLFIKELSRIAPTHLIIGNHDLINQTQFLTDNHIFNPLKEWENVHIIDEVKKFTYFDGDDEMEFVMCPYVEPGRFREALDTILEKGDSWDFAECIFAHQEFRGCKMGAIISEVGDEWDDCLPSVISGHIHEEQKVGTNIWYPGSAIQHGYSMVSVQKYVWHVNFSVPGDDIDAEPFTYKKINLGMKRKVVVNVEASEIDNFDYDSMKNDQVKLKIKGTIEEFKKLRRSEVYKKLKSNGVKFAYIPISTDVKDNRETTMTYLDVLSKLVKNNTPNVQNVFKELVQT